MSRWSVKQPIKFLLTHIFIIIHINYYYPNLRNYQLAHFTSIQSINKNKKSIRQSWHWQVPFLFFFFFLLARHGRVRRGREWWKVILLFSERPTPTHQVRVQKTSPQVNSNVLAHSLSRTDTSMEGILDKGTYLPSRSTFYNTKSTNIFKGRSYNN